MTVFLPQIDLSEEEMMALNKEAAEAGYTTMEYVRLSLGQTEAARNMRAARVARVDKREVIAPDMENKHGKPTEVARKGGGGSSDTPIK